MTRVAVITGANRGLGLGTARALRERGWHVLSTARDPASAPEPAEALEVTDPAQARALAARTGPIDLLVNNAAIAEGDARRILDVNVWGSLNVADAFAPGLRDGGAILNVSSGMGALSSYSRDVQRRFLDPALDRDGLRALLAELAGDAGRGWGGYSLSKAGLNALTRILAAELAPRRIRVSSVCPGWVKTRMGGRGAPRSLEEGVASIVAAVDVSESGRFYRDGQPIPW